ncbi:MAG: NDP-sugar synthase [Candidatus Sumerlaeia bacterium]
MTHGKPSKKSRQKIASDTRAVVLAGGKGMRLRPYTTVLPKPLMPVNDRPVLEHVLKNLKKAGFRKITISVGHLSELIQAFFGDGKKWGIAIDYAIEDKPLNTIGPLAFIENLGENFLVMNGDIMTDLDLAAFWQDHLESEAALTVATFRREVNIDFGVLRYSSGDHSIHGFEEKPVLPYDVSMGIYALNHRCLDFIPKGKSFGFDQLVLALLAAREKVRAFPHSGKWLDLGRPEDYETANREYKQ